LGIHALVEKNLEKFQICFPKEMEEEKEMLFS
jgi:hypothetical protein